MRQDTPYPSWKSGETVWQAWLRAWATIGRRHANLPEVTRRADGAYTAGPPPDGRRVEEHLDELRLTRPIVVPVRRPGPFINALDSLNRCGLPDGDSVRVMLDGLQTVDLDACRHIPGRCAKCDRQACLECRVIILPESDYEKTTNVLGDCLDCNPTEEP